MADTREILVAEDNAADVRLMREALNELEPPVRMHVARDGKEILGFLSRSEQFADAPRPNIIFLDGHLPKTDTSCILQRVKQSRGLRQIPVIVLTTSNSEELMEEAYRHGANCYLLKPLDLDDYCKTVRAAATFWLNHPLSE